MNQYITTPIYYASGEPHLGHAYTTCIASCLKRYAQLRGADVLLATGTDEHGQKIERTASRCGEDTAAFVARRSEDFLRLWQSLKLPVDLFERTTSEHHRQVVIDLWQRLVRSGDIYKGHYEGLYCVECEQYFTSGETCPVHRRPLELFSEASYFFRLSRFQDRLIRHIREHPEFISPVERRNEVLALLQQNVLHDLSISRTSSSWGIPVPNDGAHVIYVWIDALATYLSALGSLDSERVRTFWPGAVHCIGKDILTFHAVYWPAILWSAGLPLPRSIVVNGWLTVEGRKISKSDPDTIVDPAELASLVSCDGLQHYFARAVTLGQDLDFRRNTLLETVNSDLANAVGNLFARFRGLVARKYPGGLHGQADLNCRLYRQVTLQVRACLAALDAHNLTEGARCFVGIANLLNKDIQARQPWALPPGPALHTYISTLHLCLSDLTVIGSIFVPDLIDRARDSLGLVQGPTLEELGTPVAEIRPGASDVVFQRIVDAAVDVAVDVAVDSVDVGV
jgi:methionyl-tRNA synthetase